MNIIAVIDPPPLSTWCVELLTLLVDHPDITLTRLVINNCDPHTGARAPMSAAPQRWLRQILDNPRFTHTCCVPAELPTTLAALLMADTGADLTTNTLLLQLGAGVSQQTALVGSCEWHFAIDSLPERALQALSRRDPVFDIHLWQRTASTKKWELIANHALPMQTYSESDVVHAVHAALPAFCITRLNWLSAGKALSSQDALLPKPNAESTSPDLARWEHDRYDQPASQPPTWQTLLKCLYHQGLARANNWLFREQWQLAVAPTAHTSLKTPFSQYKKILPPQNYHWADPHIIEHAGQQHVFFEELRFGDLTAHICHITVDEWGIHSKPSVVLQTEHHLSYPFVFKHAGEIFMLPECAATGAVTLYQATEFPHKWMPLIDLLENIDAVDSTLHFCAGRWWLFTNRMSHPTVDERDELWLYYASELITNNWHSHPLNPIVTGVDNARMGGALFMDDGELYRPSQYGGVRYGRGVNLNRIDCLTEHDYQETTIQRHHPTPQMAHVGAHTFSRTSQFTVIDRVVSKRR